MGAALGVDSLPSTGAGAPSALAGPARRRCWWASFALVAGLMAAWALATPIFASPDEPAHTIHAIGVAHGVWLGRAFAPGHGPLHADAEAARVGLSVDVSSVYQHAANIHCLAGHPGVTANCLRLDPSRGNRPAITYTARYFPAYYLAVGSVSWVTSPGAHQIYVMRLLSVVLSAALIASAVVTILEATPSPWALIGLAVALTPMALFVAASINPNGLEIAAAIAVWVHGAAIATGRLPVVGTRLITRLGVASIVLAMNRPTSLLWLGLIGVLLLISAGRETISELLRHTASRLWAVGLAIAIALQVSWSAWADAFNVSKTFVGGPVNVTRAQYFRTTIGNSYQLLREMIGLFGWLDTYAPALTYLLWFLGIAALIAVALLVAPRLLRTLAATVILVIAVPIVVEATYVHTIGFQWQGRYTLPLAVGVPILAGLGIGLARDHISSSRRVTIVIVAGLAIAQFFAFAQALRRYMVGSDGAIWYPWSAKWHPVVPALGLLVGFAALLVVASVLVIRAGREVATGEEGGRTTPVVNAPS
jgi:hypothetical protein